MADGRREQRAEEPTRPPGAIGRGSLTRTATTPSARSALRREAALIMATRHPGVAEAVSLVDEVGLTRLITAFDDGPTLAEWTSVDIECVAGLVAALATTCSDLHRLGVVVGRIEADRIVVPASGRPILVGLEHGGPIATVPPESAPHRPPSRDSDPGRGLDPATDVHGLGALLGHLVDRDRARTDGADRATLRRLDGVVADSTASPRDGRPSASGLAQAILDAVPDAHLPTDEVHREVAPAGSGPTGGREPGPTSRHGLHGPRRPVSRPAPDETIERSGLRRAGAAILVGLGCAAFIGSCLATESRPSASGSDEPPDVEPPITAPRRGASATSPASDRSEPTATAPPTTRPTPAQSEVGSDDPMLIVFDEVTYRLDEHRRYSVGDWDCDGEETLAALDPSSGTLTLFDSWPEAGSMTASPADQLPEAVALRTVRSNDSGCDRLVVVYPDGVEAYPPGGEPR